jgi:hypothetical protein
MAGFKGQEQRSRRETFLSVSNRDLIQTADAHYHREPWLDLANELSTARKAFDIGATVPQFLLELLEAPI